MSATASAPSSSSRDLALALHEAAAAGNLRAVRTFLAPDLATAATAAAIADAAPPPPRVDPNAANQINGWTALHWAARRGRGRVAVLLLAAGADPSARDTAGRRPADLVPADSGGSAERLRLRLEAAELAGPAAARADAAAAAEAFLGLDADLDDQDDDDGDNAGSEASGGGGGGGFVPNYLRHPDRSRASAHPDEFAPPLHTSPPAPPPKPEALAFPPSPPPPPLPARSPVPQVLSTGPPSAVAPVLWSAPWTPSPTPLLHHQLREVRVYIGPPAGPTATAAKIVAPEPDRRLRLVGAVFASPGDRVCDVERRARDELDGLPDGEWQLARTDGTTGGEEVPIGAKQSDHPAVWHFGAAGVLVVRQRME
ncbi:hypothetical protein HK405_007643 [Cladochytrium tenue]|nr:hypothetical protein HK405_007643 [Cladochytrium tenue]